MCASIACMPDDASASHLNLWKKRLGRVPVETDHVEWEKWRFEIVDMDGQRIDKVLAQPIVVAEVDD